MADSLSLDGQTAIRDISRPSVGWIAEVPRLSAGCLPPVSGGASTGVRAHGIWQKCDAHAARRQSEQPSEIAFRSCRSLTRLQLREEPRHPQPGGDSGRHSDCKRDFRQSRANASPNTRCAAPHRSAPARDSTSTIVPVLAISGCQTFRALPRRMPAEASITRPRGLDHLGRLSSTLRFAA